MAAGVVASATAEVAAVPDAVIAATDVFVPLAAVSAQLYA